MCAELTAFADAESFLKANKDEVFLNDSLKKFITILNC